MLGDHFLCTLTISGFPGSTFPGLLDALNHLQTEYRWMTRFLCLDKLEAKSLIEKYRRQWWAKRKGLWTMIKEEASQQEAALIDNAAANKAADADAALQELGDDLVSFGYLTATVTVWDRDLEPARRKAQRVKETIQSQGFTVRDETLNSTEAWLGSLPGHVYANVRRPIVSSMNLAHLMPLSAVWAGDAVNRHLESVCGVGEPHLYCSTTGSTPFRLHLAVGDVGHTLVIGPTGAGKSTLLGMLALGWLKYPGAQVIIFDKDRSARAATLAVGGACYEPGSDRAPVAFQPLADIDQAPERVWAAGFVATLLAAQGVAVDHGIQSAIDDTLSGARERTAPRADAHALGEPPRLARAAPARRAPSLHARRQLRPDLRRRPGRCPRSPLDDDRDGPLHGPRAKRSSSRRSNTCFTASSGSSPGSRRSSSWTRRGSFSSHPVFARRLQAWLKTLRKKNVYVVFATQEVADATSKPELLSTILSACHTKIFLPDEEALTPAMSAAYQSVGLTTAEIEILAKAQKKRDYYYRSVKGRRLFQLGLGPAALAFVGASSETDQRFLDELVATRPEREYASAMLERRGVTWAAAALRRELESAATIAPSNANPISGDVAVDDTPTNPMLDLAARIAVDTPPISIPHVAVEDAPTVVVPHLNLHAETVAIPLDADFLDEDAVTLRIPLTERPAP